MTDKMVDVGGRCRRPTFFGRVFRRLHQCRPPTSVQLADIQASVVRQHCRSSFPTLRLTSATDVSVSVGQLVRRRRLTSA